MKLDKGQLIGYNMKNIILVKFYTKFGVKTSPSSFFKKSKLSRSLDEQSEVSYNLFIMNIQVEDYQLILKLRC